MKRDMDLVRKIMLEVADSRNPLPASMFVSEHHDIAEVGYHFKIMHEAGLMKARILGADDDPYWKCDALELTWEGQEFLANVKSDSLWSKVKAKVGKTAGDASFRVLAKVAERAAEEICTNGMGVL